MLRDRVLYVHVTGGMSASKLAEGIDRRLGVATTARIWNTVSELAEMAAITATDMALYAGALFTLFIMAGPVWVGVAAHVVGRVPPRLTTGLGRCGG